MRARALLAGLLLALAWPSGAEDRWPASGGGSGVNIAVDTNGNGRADYILVGDIDGDGTLEATDIQAAHNRLRASSDENAAAGAKPDLTVSLTDAACGGATACVIRTVGSWLTDGFTNSLPVYIAGFEKYTTGRRALGTAVNTACATDGDAGATDNDCFTLVDAGDDFVTYGFTANMTVYAYFFNEQLNSGTPITRSFTVVNVTATEMEVSCTEDAVGTGCLTTEDIRPGRWVESPGVNGNYTVHGSVAVTATILPLTAEPPKAEAATPTLAGQNMPVVSDRHPITLELVDGTYTAPAAAPANSTHAIIELTSFTTLRGTGRSVIQPNSDVTLRSGIGGPRQNWYPGFVTDLIVSDLVIDGGWDVGAGGADNYMGITMGGWLNTSVSRVRIHDTGHACIHHFNSAFTDVNEVKCERNGDWANLSGVSQAAIYHYAGQLGKAALTIGTVVRDVRISQAPIGIHQRRETAADELANPVIRDVTVTNTGSGNCAWYRGAREPLIDGLRCIATGPVNFDAGATAYGDTFSSFHATLRNLSIIRPTNASSTSATGIILGDFHDRPTFEGLHIQGGSGALPCIHITQPVRGAVFKNVLLEDCPGQFVLIAGIDQGTEYASSADAAITFENVTMRSNDDVDAFVTNRDGFVTSVDTSHLILRDFVIEGVTGNALDMQRCFDCMIENGVISGVQPRFIGIGTEAWAATIACDLGHENWWLATNNASGVDDIVFASGTGASQSEVFCNGDGTWAAMTVAGANQDTITFPDGIEDSVIRNLTIKDTRDADGLNITGSAINNVFQNIRCENTGAWGTLGDMNDCLTNSDQNASNAANVLTGLSCQGLDEQCFAWDAGAEPTGVDANGQYDDFTAGSQFPVAAAPIDECTPGQLFQRAGGGAATSLYICEAAAGPPVGK